MPDRGFTVTRLSILILAVGMILATGCRRQPERTPDAHFSGGGGGLMPVTFGEMPSKNLLQPAASVAVATAEEPEEAAVEEEPIEEEEAGEEVEEAVEATPAPTPANSNKPKRPEYDPNDPVNSTVQPGFLPRG